MWVAGHVSEDSENTGSFGEQVVSTRTEIVKKLMQSTCDVTDPFLSSSLYHSFVPCKNSLWAMYYYNSLDSSLCS